jgi:hypothetical protein
MRHTEQRLAQLNSLANDRAVASASPSGSKIQTPKLSFSTTAHCLQIVANFGPNNVVNDLPSFEAGNRRAAPVELWIHTSLGDNSQLTDRTATDPRASGSGQRNSQADIAARLETLARSVPLLAKMDSKKLVAFVAEQHVRIDQVNDWKVIALEKPTDRSKATPPPTAVVVRKPMLPPVASRQPPPPAAPRQAGPRIWTSGIYTAHAEFIGLEGNIVRLRRVSGVTTRRPVLP